MPGLIPSASWRSPKPMPSTRASAPRLAETPAPLRVLVVDDEALIRWSLRRALLQRGHEVVEAADAAHALQACTGPDAAFDVVLLDYRLPDCHDSRLLSEVRELAPTAAIFMMTAYGDDTMRAQAHALGARAVVDKPFQLEAFIGMIEAASRTKN